MPIEICCGSANDSLRRELTPLACDWIMPLLSKRLDKKRLEKWRIRQRKKINAPNIANKENIERNYAKKGLKPRWVDYYRTKHRFLAVQVKEAMEGMGFAMRIIEHKEGGKFDRFKGDGKPTYSVQLYDSESPLISHRFERPDLPKNLQPSIPQEKWTWRKKLKRLIPP